MIRIYLLLVLPAQPWKLFALFSSKRNWILNLLELKTDGFAYFELSSCDV